jgi:hypothetical protein
MGEQLVRADRVPLVAERPEFSGRRRVPGHENALADCHFRYVVFFFDGDRAAQQALGRRRRLRGGRIRTLSAAARRTRRVLISGGNTVAVDFDR